MANKEVFDHGKEALELQESTQVLPEEHPHDAPAWEVPREVREVQVPPEAQQLVARCDDGRCRLPPQERRGGGLRHSTEAGATMPPLILRVVTERGCPACTLTAPHLRALSRRLPALGVVKVPTDAPTPGWRPRYVPSMSLETKDGRVLARRSGFATAVELEGWIGRAVSRAAPKRAGLAARPAPRGP